MEKLFIDTLSFVEKKLILRVTPCIGMRFGKIIFSKYNLPDSSYGEWLFYRDKMPKFYYSAFNEDGSQNRIAEYITQHHLDFESFLISILKQKGFNKIHANYNDIIQFDNKSKLEEIEILEMRWIGIE